MSSFNTSFYTFTYHKIDEQGPGELVSFGLCPPTYYVCIEMQRVLWMQRDDVRSMLCYYNYFWEKKTLKWWSV